MKEIHLVPKLTAIVDDEDFDWLMKYEWFAVWDGRRKTFYAATEIDGEQVMMHDLIMSQVRTDKERH